MVDTSHQSANPADKGNKKPPRFRHSRKASLLRTLAINLLLIMLPVGLYYFAVVQKQKAYATERGFRALTEARQQADKNLIAFQSIAYFLASKTRETYTDRNVNFKSLVQEIVNKDKCKNDGCREELKKFNYLINNYKKLIQGFLQKTEIRIKPVYEGYKFGGNEKYLYQKENKYFYVPERCMKLDLEKNVSSNYLLKDTIVGVSIDDPYEMRFTTCFILFINEKTQDTNQAVGLMFELSTNMDSLFRSSAAIDEFEQVLVFVSDGRLVYSHNQTREISQQDESVHAAVRNPGKYIWFDEVLKHGNLIEKYGNESTFFKFLNKSDNPEKLFEDRQAKIGEQMILERSIEGVNHAVFIKTVRSQAFIKPALPDALAGRASEVFLNCLSTAVCQKNQGKNSYSDNQLNNNDDIYYLVGLKKKGDLKTATSHIEPLLVMAISFLIIATFFMWPLVRLIFLEAHDSLTNIQIIHIIISSILLCGSLLLFMNSLTHITETSLFLDKKAKQIRNDISEEFNQSVTKVIEHIAKSNSIELFSNNVNYLIADENKDYCATGSNYSLHSIHIACLNLNENSREWYKQALRNDFINIFKVDKFGNKQEFFSMLSKSLVPKKMNLSDREYFKRLESKRYWSTVVQEGISQEFIIERIYQKSSGKKTTIFAIPHITVEKSGSSEQQDDIEKDFNGIVAADVSLYNFIYSVLPMHFRFAIFDRNNGTVLFHSDDRRSLVENFYLETEYNPQLLSAVREQKQHSFQGRYHGESTKFHYTPLADIPWGLVVIYPTYIVDGIILESFVNGLVAYIPFVILVFIAILPVFYFLGKVDWIWPQWNKRTFYRSSLPIILISSIYYLGLRESANLTTHILLLLLLPISLFICCKYHYQISSGSVLNKLNRYFYIYALAGCIFLLIPVIGSCITQSTSIQAVNSIAMLVINLILLLALIFYFVWSVKYYSENFYIFLITIVLPIMLIDRWYSISQSNYINSQECIDIYILLITFLISLTLYITHAIENRPFKDSKFFNITPSKLFQLNYIFFLFSLIAGLVIVPVFDLSSRSINLHVNGAIMTGLSNTAENIISHYTKKEKDLLSLTIPDISIGNERINDIPNILSLNSSNISVNEYSSCDVMGFSKESRDTTIVYDEKLIQNAYISKCSKKIKTSEMKESQNWVELVWREWMPVFSEDTGRTQYINYLNDKIFKQETLRLDRQNYHLSLITPEWEMIKKISLDKDEKLPYLLGMIMPYVFFTIIIFSLLYLLSIRLFGFKVSLFSEKLSGDQKSFSNNKDFNIKDFRPAHIMYICPKKQDIGHLVDMFFDENARTDKERKRLIPRRTDIYESLSTALNSMIQDRTDIAEQDQSFKQLSQMNVDAESLCNNDTIKVVLNNKHVVKSLDLAKDTIIKQYGPQAKNCNLIYILENLDVAVLDSQRRVKVLEYLEEISTHAVIVFLKTELPPLYRLVYPQAYPSRGYEEELHQDEIVKIEDSELLRWCDVISRFEKTYPYRGPILECSEDEGTEDMKAVKEYAKEEIKSFAPEIQYLEENLINLITSRIIKNKRLVQEYISIHGEIVFRRRWEYCTRQERLALYQLARGWLPNPQNDRVLQYLIRRGFLEIMPRPKIIGETLRSFILTAEPPGRFDTWQQEAAEGTWQTIRLPFLIILMLLVAWLAHTSGDIFATITTLLISTVGFFAAALQAFSFAKGVDVQSK